MVESNITVTSKNHVERINEFPLDMMQVFESKSRKPKTYEAASVKVILSRSNSSLINFLIKDTQKMLFKLESGSCDLKKGVSPPLIFKLLELLRRPIRRTNASLFGEKD